MKEKEELIKALCAIKTNIIKYINLEISLLRKEVGPIIEKPIWDLDLSWSTANLLFGAGIKKIENLLDMTAEDLLKIRNFGRKRLSEVKYSLDRYGLSLKRTYLTPIERQEEKI